MALATDVAIMTFGEPLEQNTTAGNGTLPMGTAVDKVVVTTGDASQSKYP